MLKRSPTTYQQGQWGMIATLVSVVIIIALLAWMLPTYLGSGQQSSKPGGAASPKQRARGAVCSEYAAQMNQAVALYKADHDDKPPATLDDLKPYGVTDDIVHAPGCSYAIDPATGTVTETGRGMAPPSAAPAATPTPPSGGTPGPGGIKIPDVSGGL